MAIAVEVAFAVDIATEMAETMALRSENLEVEVIVIALARPI